MALTHSDSYTEDKGYNRNHRQTEGGLRAYGRGERPKCHWNKKLLLNDLESTLDLMVKDTKLTTRLRNIYKTYGLSKDEVLSIVRKQKFDDLWKGVIEVKGHHYTGNYYQYTLFYGLKEGVSILNYIAKTVTPYKKEYKQLTLL